MIYMSVRPFAKPQIVSFFVFPSHVPFADLQTTPYIHVRTSDHQTLLRRECVLCAASAPAYAPSLLPFLSSADRQW